MIISASYKTDIPALYGRWFLRRLEAGYCRTVNPYSGQLSEVSLRPADVDGFVFWTRNLGPFFPALEEVRRRGWPFLVQYTITGYPRELEPGVVEAGRSVEFMKRVAGEYGPRAAVWRYDTIVHSSLTGLDTSLTAPLSDGDFHLRNFERLAAALEGSTDEVVVSFAQICRKTERNLRQAAAAGGFTWGDPPEEAKRGLLRKLAACAAARGMRLTVCGQREFVEPGIGDAQCVDALRLGELAGRLLGVRHKAHRKDCGCWESRDIGEYDTCTQGCAYCYAVSSRAAARRRFRAHDPEGEFLFAPGR